MGRLKVNLFANVTAAVWVACVQLACVPLLIRLIGVDGYGLVGFYLTLQLGLRALDLGLSATINRELARQSTLATHAEATRDFLHTLELGCWLIAGVISATVWLLAPALTDHWLHAAAPVRASVLQAIRWMALALLFQWPGTFYQAGLIGLQRFMPLAAVRMGATTFCTLGGVGVLWLWSPRLELFFAWQALGGALQASVLVLALWRAMPHAGRRPRVDFSRVQSVLPYARGTGAIGVLGILLSQMDRVVLSRTLDLTDFGAYTVAWTAAGCLQLFITPIFQAVSPRLAALVARHDEAAVRELYHAGTQLMAACVIGTSLTMAIFAEPLLLLWTRETTLAATAAPLVVLLLIGTALNGLMHLPYGLQLAYGWTRPGLLLNLAQLTLFAPLLLWAASRYGATGGAAVWALMNLCALLCGLPLTHRRLLRGEAWRWLARDVLLPLCAAGVVALLLKALLTPLPAGLTALPLIGVSGLAIGLAAVLSVPLVRAGLPGAGLRAAARAQAGTTER